MTDLNKVEIQTSQFLKWDGKNKIVFKLKDTTKTDIKRIWDKRPEADKKTDKKMYVSGDTIIQANGIPVAFDIAINVSPKDFLEAFNDKPYPNNLMNRDYKIRRVVIVDKVEYALDMPKKASYAIESAVQSAIGNELTPTELYYTITVEGDGVTKTFNVVTSKKNPLGEDVSPSSIKEVEPILQEERVFVEKFNQGMVYKDGTKVAMNKPGFLKAYMEYGGDDVERGNFIWSELVEVKK